MIKSLKLASYNWKVLVKAILLQVLLLALVIALGSLVFGNLFDDVAQLISENGVKEFLTNTVNSIFSAEFDSEVFASELGNMIANLRNSIAELHIPFGGVTMSYVLIVVVLVAYRLFVSLADVTCGCQLEEFMTANAERPFTWFFVKKQGAAWKFVLLQTALVLPLDILIVSGSVGFYLMFLIAFNWWTIIPVALIALLFYVVRQTLFAFCLPAVVCEDLPTRKAFKLGLSKIMSRFWRVFWKTLIVMCLMVGISVVSLAFIHNRLASTVVLTVPNFVLFFYLKCINFVEYFQADNKPFFYKRVEVEGTERYNRKHDNKANKNK